MVSKWAMIVFFFVAGLSFFVPFAYAALIEAVAALVAAVALALNK